MNAMGVSAHSGTGWVLWGPSDPAAPMGLIVIQKRLGLAASFSTALKTSSRMSPAIVRVLLFRYLDLKTIQLIAISFHLDLFIKGLRA
jgi:hypothetical protein